MAMSYSVLCISLIVFLRSISVAALGGYELFCFVCQPVRISSFYFCGCFGRPPKLMGRAQEKANTHEIQK